MYHLLNTKESLNAHYESQDLLNASGPHVERSLNPVCSLVSESLSTGRAIRSGFLNMPRDLLAVLLSWGWVLHINYLARGSNERFTSCYLRSIYCWMNLDCRPLLSSFTRRF